MPRSLAYPHIAPTSFVVSIGADTVRAHLGCRYSPALLGAAPAPLLPPPEGVDMEAAELMPLAAAESPALAAIAPTAAPPGPPAAPPARSPMVFADRTIDAGRFMPK